MDSEMVMEVPDTPERVAFSRSVGESSLSTRGFEDRPSSSNQYLEPTTRTYYREIRNPNLHDFTGNNATPVDGEFLFSQARKARLISNTPDNKTTHLRNSSPKPGQSSALSYSETIPKVIDLSQGSPSPLSYPKCPRNKEEKHLSRQSERYQINGFGKLGERSSVSTEGIKKERNTVGNTMKAFVSSNNTNEGNNLNFNARVVSCDKEKVIVQQPNSRARNEQLLSRHVELGFPQRDLNQKKLPIACILPCDLANNRNNSQSDAYYQELINSPNQRISSLVKNKDNEIGNGLCRVSQSTARQANHRHRELTLNPKNNGHRRLVRDGCISPSNIARNKNDSKAKGIEKGNVISRKILNGHSFQSIHHSSSRGCIVDKGKGKEIINEEFLANSQHIGAIPPSRSSCLMPEKEVTIISDMDFDTDRIQIDGCGATHKHVGCSFRPSSNAACISERENIPSHLSSLRGEISEGGSKYSLSVADKPEVATFQSRENISQVQECFKLDSEAPHHTGKRKISFAHSNAGECSSSTVHSPRILYDRTSVKHSYPRSRRSQKSVRVDTALAPIVEIDELDGNTQGENHELSDESIARSIQLESDEVLARQLQEQFYLESPPVGAAEEEDDLHTFHRRQNQYQQREALHPTLVGRPRFHHSSTMTARSRTENRIGRIRRNTSRPNMSLEARLEFLEALEAAFENGNGMETPDRFLDVQREFNENDYEILLALDENNHQHGGASERQINNLPQSLIQNIDSEEACAVCLETPSVGDTVRHLPCLHKFHKDCIDTWLRRKRSCPICKSGIT